MIYLIRTTGERSLDESYNQIDAKIIIDHTHQPIDNFIDCLYQLNDEGGVLLEDDLVLCNNFKEEIERVIESRPNRIINFFQSPRIYREIEDSYNIAWNQCTYYPKGIGKQIANLMVTLPRTYGTSKKRYSVLEKKALTQLDIKVLQYKPHLVQHLNPKSMIFDMKVSDRESIYFLDYLNELGITYEEAKDPLNQRKLIQIMREDFKKRNL